MALTVTITLPEPAYRSAERLARNSRRPVQNVLSELLSESLTAWEQQSVTELPDHELLGACRAQMTPEQDMRLNDLLDKQREGQLNDDERPEMWALTRVYERLLVRKAEALAEAKQRGLSVFPVD